MFTGLIEDVGRVHAVRLGETTRISVATRLPVQEIALGDSVAVDGCCLTVVERVADRLAFEATAETLRRTTLEGYVPGARVNLERALALGERLGGHLVQGHVDATAKVLRTWREGRALGLAVELPAPLAPLFIEKGSATVDGVSLTVNALGPAHFEVMLIPETQVRTALGDKGAGARVNLEADLIGKHVARLMEVRTGGLQASDIERAGFERKRS